MIIHTTITDPRYDPKRHPGDYRLVQHRYSPILARYAMQYWAPDAPTHWIKVGDTYAERGEHNGLLSLGFWALPIVFPDHLVCDLCEERMSTHEVAGAWKGSLRAKETGVTDAVVCDKHAAYYRSTTKLVVVALEVSEHVTMLCTPFAMLSEE